MNSICEFSKSAFNSRLSRSVLLALCVFYVGGQPADALSFFPKKKATAESIPPSAQISPNLLTTPTQPQPGPTAQPVTVADPLQVLISKGIFPPDAATRTQPLTRAELADILVKALGHNTQMVSEFPVYRDVPKDHWAYVSIEVAREKKLIQHLYSKGFYYPDQAVSYNDVYSAIARAITGPMPSPEVTDHLLQDFEDKDSLPRYMRPLVAKMAQVRFFKHTGESKPMLRPKEPVYAKDLAPLISYLTHLIEGRSTIVADEEQYIPILPPGLRLSISPSTAILEPQLNVGSSVTFTLVNPVQPLPKGSRLSGLVEEAQLTSHVYHIEILEAQAPDGTNYQTSAPLVLTFSTTKNKLGFFVPGELFEVVTQIPLHSPSVEMTPVLPTNPTPAPAGKRPPPSFTPRSTQ